MRRANQFICFAFRMIVALSACSLTVSSARPDSSNDRKNAAKNLAKEIQQAQFHKVYVPDFLDSSGARTEKGCFFASSFSTDLAKNAHNFEVVNRIQAQRHLDDLHISAQDFQQTETLGKAATALGADAVLVGTATISPKDASLILSLRDGASGKEVYSMEYREKLKRSFEASFPAGLSEDSHIYYFPGLDGISQPKCIRCPSPDYTDEARQNGIQAAVLVSVHIDEKGVIRDARVVESPNDSLTRQCLDVVKNWQMQPAHDLDGNAVPIRAVIEITFRRFG